MIINFRISEKLFKDNINGICEASAGKKLRTEKIDQNIREARK